MTSEVIETHGELPTKDPDAYSQHSHYASSNEQNSRYEDVTSQDDSCTDHSTTSSSFNPDQSRDRGSTITKKIPLSEYATLQGILAHEVDEGAVCLKCGPEVCPGLDLHFWKKVCKNCGCPRASHKIEKRIEEKKEVPRSILLQTADEDEEDYKELEISAPPTKVQIKGKEDTRNSDKFNEQYLNDLRDFYRNKSHGLNLPEDKKLSPEQILILQQYINQTQGEEVISPEVLQNHITALTRDRLDASDNDLSRSKSSASVNSDSSDLPLSFLQALQLATLNKESLRTDSTSPHPILGDPTYNAAMPNNHQRSYSSESEDDETSSSRTRSYSSDDRTRSDEYTHTEESYTKDLSTLPEEEEEEEETTTTTTTTSSNRKMMNIQAPPVVREEERHHEDSTIEMIDRLTDVSRIQNTETVIQNRVVHRPIDEQDESYTSSEEEEDRSAPPPKPIRRNPGSFDDLTQGDIVDYYTTVSPSGEVPSTQTYQRKGSPGVWVPPGIDHALVKQYLAALPEDKRPVNTLGVQWRIKQLQTQLPRYDHNINYCHEMSPEEQDELFLFVDGRKEKAQGQGEVKSFKKKHKKKCEKCGGVVDCAIIADKVPGRVWHPGCFTCATCDEILVDLIYFQFDNKLYCGRHHAELLRPRCHACDELIFGQEFITADKHEYHKEHFCCWECDTSLGGTKYVSHKGQPYCQGCYEKLFCTRCVTCREPIGVGVPVYKHGPLRWHGNPSCYACSFCKTSLVNRTFMPTERYVYCSKNCYRCHESLKKTKNK